MYEDGTNLQRPEFGPGRPDYPELTQLVRVTGPALPGTMPRVYPCLVQQWTPPQGVRDREPAWVFEVNDLDLGLGYRMCRLVNVYPPQSVGSPTSSSATAGSSSSSSSPASSLPLYATACCPLGSSSSSSSSSSSVSSSPAAGITVSCCAGIVLPLSLTAMISAPGCPCIDNLSVGLIWNGTTNAWTSGNIPTSCPGTPSMPTLNIQLSCASGLTCSQFLLSFQCNTTSYSTRYNPSGPCSCSPLDLVFNVNNNDPVGIFCCGSAITVTITS